MHAMNDLYDEIYDSDIIPGVYDHSVYDQAFVFYDEDEDEDEECEYEEIVGDLPTPNMPPAQA